MKGGEGGRETETETETDTETDTETETNTHAPPKSAIFATKLAVRKMFAVLISR